MTDIVNVRGSAAHHLLQVGSGGVWRMAVPRWNFHKHLVDADVILSSGLCQPQAVVSKVTGQRKNAPVGVRMAITGSQLDSSNSLAVPVFKS